MVLVRSGRIAIGKGTSPDSEPNVTEVESFWISRTEVTINLWRQYLEATETYFRTDNYYWGDLVQRSESSESPIVYVTWWHAVDFCNWLSRHDGLEPVYEFADRPAEWGHEAYRNANWGVTWNRDANGYRLPSEAEWEYAARGGANRSGTRFAGGNDPSRVGWWRSNSDGIVHDVGQKKPNELGIYDMSGNAREWCWDVYLPDHAESASETHPSRTTSEPQASERVMRGGAAIGTPKTIFDRSSFLPHGTEFVTVRPVRNAE